MKERATGQQRDRFLARVDQVFVFGAGRRLGTNTEHPVLAMKKDFAALGNVVGHERGQADAKIDISALRNVLGDTRSDLVAVPFFHAVAPVRTTRFTKIPGVTTDSGSSSPSSTVLRT